VLCRNVSVFCALLPLAASRSRCGALFSVCDGMVYAELGAAMPGAGGAYIYFREAFNPRTWGHLFSFLFLWETIFVAPLAISAACVGFADYTHYFFPGLNHARVGALAAAGCALITVLLYRPIKAAGVTRSRCSAWCWLPCFG
jgi:amino acid transporter